jgi:hypothetical protein
VRLITSLIAAFCLGSSVYAQGWEFSEERNPLTGKSDVWVRLVAAEPTVTASRSIPNHMVLYVACLEGQFAISVDTGEYMGRGRLRVRYRADEGEPITEDWVAAPDGVAMFLPPMFKDFEAAMNTAQEIAMEFRDYRGVTYRTLFAGLGKNRYTVGQIYRACGK